AKPKCSANQPAHRAGSATDNAKPITFLVCIELLSKQRHTEYYGQSTTCIVFSVPDESPNPWHAPTSPADAHYWTPPSTSSPTTAPAASLTAPSTPQPPSPPEPPPTTSPTATTSSPRPAPTSTCAWPPVPS